MGCQSEPYLPPAPVGPGAATKTDLQPWVECAKPARCQGYLQSIYVHSREGTYVTWSLHTEQSAYEIDIRNCNVSADKLRNREVIIFGKLLGRGPDHLPLLVANQIAPYGGDNDLPIASASVNE